MLSVRRLRERLRRFLPILLLLWVNTIARSEAAGQLTCESLTKEIRAGFKRLNDVYWSATLSIWLDRPGDDLRAHFEGRRNPPWWPSANAVEALIDFMAVSGAPEYDAVINSLYELQKDHPARQARVVAELKRRNQWNETDEQKLRQRAKSKEAGPAQEKAYYSDFQNEYLDDTGWWGITWLKMYDRTGAEKYLATAKSTQAHMAKNWKPEVGGGIVWSEDADKQRPNAITNGLFIILSAGLHQRTHEQTYLRDAERALEWMRKNGLFDGEGVVDAPGHQGDYWTYNQGVYIGALTALYNTTGKREYLDEARDVAEGVLHRSGIVDSNGVIVEKLGISGDSALFKGILVRYLAHFRNVLATKELYPETVRAIDRCIRSSVESLLEHGISDGGLFAAEWHQTAEHREVDFDSQVSGLAALVGLLETVPRR